MDEMTGKILAASTGLAEARTRESIDGETCKHAVPWTQRCEQCEREDINSRREEAIRSGRRYTPLETFPPTVTVTRLEAPTTKAETITRLTDANAARHEERTAVREALGMPLEDPMSADLKEPARRIDALKKQLAEWRSKAYAARTKLAISANEWHVFRHRITAAAQQATITAGHDVAKVLENIGRLLAKSDTNIMQFEATDDVSFLPCTRCKRALGVGAIVGDGDGSGNRFAHRECYEVKP